jgi:hypothetical protein
MTLLLFLLVFVLASQVLAFAIALIARSWVWRTERVILRGIDVERAREVVATYMESVSDTRFGFPTGVFRVTKDEPATTRLVARELDFSGSTALDLGRFAMAIPAAFIAAGSDEGCAAGIIALMLAVAAAMFLVVPMVLIGIVEVVLRWLMRSRIVAQLEPAEADENACAVSFELTGLSAFGLRRSLLSGLAAPLVPARWGGPVVSDTDEPWFNDRLNVAYAGGSAIAAITAIVVIAATPAARHGSPSVAYQPVVQTSSPPETITEASSSSTSSTSSAPSSTSSEASTDPEAESSGSSSDSTSTDLAASAARGDDFTIRRPTGDWVLDHLEVQKPGYIETRWHLAGAPNIIFLVDHTPGYTGTARAGAEGVRDPFQHVSSYHEVGFGAQNLPAGEAWRWEYEVDGEHSVDTFLMTCNTGYAVRGATPASEWTRYGQTFEDAIATLTPRCA